MAAAKAGGMTEVTSYTELIEGLKAQLGALNIRYGDFDDLAGFPAGLSGKVFGPAQVKRLGPEKLFDAIRAAGLRIKLETDPEQLAKMQNRIAEQFNPRQANQARAGNHASTISSHLLSRAFGHVMREARKKRWAGTTQAQRSEHARAIANARWKKVRKRRKVAQKRRQRAKLAEVAAGVAE